MRHRTIRRGLPRHRLAATGLTVSLGVLAALLPAPATGAAEGGHIVTQVTFPDGSVAGGAEVRLLAVRRDVQLRLANTVADAAGRVDVPVPATPDLIALANQSGGSLHVLLTALDQQGTDAVPVYYKVVRSLYLTYDPVTQGFSSPALPVTVLRTLAEYDATLVRSTGEKTLAQVGVLADQADQDIVRAKAALDVEMEKHGWLSHNEALAYNVHTADGFETWITYLPDNVVVRDADDYDVYQMLPLTTGGFPVVDTTDVGFAVDDVLGNIPTVLATEAGNGSSSSKGKFSRQSGSCFTVLGPKYDKEKARYERRVCHMLDHQEMDSTKGVSYWQFTMESNGDAMNTDNMSRLWVEGAPWGHDTAPMTQDGLGTPDQTETYDTSNCTTSGISYTVSSGKPVTGGIGHNTTKTRCKAETYGPKFYPDDGHLASIWSTTDPRPAGTVRAVSMAVPIWTATSEGTPEWSLMSGQWVNGSH
jgi:hypothetical protein